MSHASYAQLPEFIEKCSKVLKEGGKVLFSIRLTEGNAYGSEGAPEETKDDECQYPGCSFFAIETVVKEASKYFSNVEHKKEYTKYMTDDSRSVSHDWIVLTK